MWKREEKLIEMTVVWGRMVEGQEGEKEEEEEGEEDADCQQKNKNPTRWRGKKMRGNYLRKKVCCVPFCFWVLWPTLFWNLGDLIWWEARQLSACHWPILAIYK